jgi:hypothetical protein
MRQRALGVNIQPAKGGQFSTGADSWTIEWLDG